MTPRSLGIVFGAAALVAAASFALGRSKKSERQTVVSEEERLEKSGNERGPVPSSLPEATSEEPNDPESVAIVEKETEENLDRALAEAIEEELKEPTVRELHLPVIRAIRENHPDPQARKDAMLKALRATGPTRDPWAQRGREVFEKWENLMPQDFERATLRETVACYQAGCEMAVRFASREDAEKGADAFRQLQDASSEHHAGRVKTPAVEVGGGAYEANWIMLRPEGS